MEIKASFIKYLCGLEKSGKLFLRNFVFISILESGKNTICHEKILCG